MLDTLGDGVTTRIVVGTSSQDGPRAPVLEGKTEILTVPDDVERIVLFKEGEEVERIPLTLSVEEPNVVRL